MFSRKKNYGTRFARKEKRTVNKDNMSTLRSTGLSVIRLEGFQINSLKKLASKPEKEEEAAIHLLPLQSSPHQSRFNDRDIEADKEGFIFKEIFRFAT